MKAFNNDIKQKEHYVNHMIAHAKADEIVQGQGWEKGKGCFIGCTFNEYNHSKFESESIGPIWLAKLADRIFEGLSKSDAKQFAIDFYPAINVGSDLNKIKIPFLIFVVESAREKTKNERSLAAIDGVLLELRRDVLDIEKLRAARAAAYAAYAAAAYAAADAAADAADAAAYAAAAYAADAAAAYAAAAYAAATAAADADAAARRNEYSKFANKLLQLMRECK